MTLSVSYIITWLELLRSKSKEKERDVVEDVLHTESSIVDDMLVSEPPSDDFNSENENDDKNDQISDNDKSGGRYPVRLGRQWNSEGAIPWDAINLWAVSHIKGEGRCNAVDNCS